MAKKQKNPKKFSKKVAINPSPGFRTAKSFIGKTFRPKGQITPKPIGPRTQHRG